MSLTITAWNIMQGGGGRVNQLIAGLEAFDTDVAILSEWRATSPNRLVEQLASAGYSHTVEFPDPTGGYAAVLVASRRPVEASSAPVYSRPEDGHRFVPFCVGGFEIGAALIPGVKQLERKAAFWRFLTKTWAPAVAGKQAMLIGDLNTGLHYRDELGATFSCSESMQELEAAGWRDAWIERNLESRPPATWYSPGYGNPFRLDHAILSPATRRARSVEYPESVGERPIFEAPKISDHLPLVVRL